jgi:hypothetical protein
VTAAGVGSVAHQAGVAWIDEAAGVAGLSIHQALSAGGALSGDDVMARAQLGQLTGAASWPWAMTTALPQ